ALAETAEIDSTVRAERGTVHDGHARGAKLADATRIALRAAITRWRLSRRAAFAQRPQPHRVINEERASRVAARVKFAVRKNARIRRQPRARTAVDAPIRFRIENK